MDRKTNGVYVIFVHIKYVLEVKRVSDRVMSVKLEIEGGGGDVCLCIGGLTLNFINAFAPKSGVLEGRER